MDATKTKFKSVEEYMSVFPASTRSKLQGLRTAIKKAAPQAEELISYNMPGYKLQGMLVYYAGYAGHIGFYPGTSAIEAFKKELSAYEGAKGTVRFPIDKPIPLSLISKMVKYRVKENLEKAERKTIKRSK